MAIAGLAEAFAPTGEFPVSGGWKPRTLNSFLRHSGSGLSGRPPSEPFRPLKRATRFIISSRFQFFMSRQSLMFVLRCRDDIFVVRGFGFVPYGTISRW